MKMLKVTTPFGTRTMTITEWIETGETRARQEMEFVKCFDPDNPSKITVEFLEK